jgi:hypothetical protein
MAKTYDGGYGIVLQDRHCLARPGIENSRRRRESRDDLPRFSREFLNKFPRLPARTSSLGCPKIGCSLCYILWHRRSGTIFVVRLVTPPILPATRFTEDFRSSCPGVMKRKYRARSYPDLSIIHYEHHQAFFQEPRTKSSSVRCRGIPVSTPSSSE